MYKKIEDWIYVAQKAEMEAIEQMCCFIKQHIESEKKIEPELQMMFMDFTVNKKILNFITPPPPLRDAKEDYRSDKFSIDQLDFLLKEFEMTEASQMTREKFRDKAVVEIFISKLNSSNLFSGFLSPLPLDWRSFTQSKLRHMVINLDHDRTGFINWRTMYTYLALLKSPIATDQQLKSCKGCMTQEAFVREKWWFEQTERSVDAPGHHPFERVRFLKELLFRVHSRMVPGKDEPVVDLDRLREIFVLPRTLHPKTPLDTYSDFLFAPLSKNQI